MLPASFKKLKIFKSPWLCAALITICGTEITNIDARGTSLRTLTIALPKLSPAVAALEDTIKTWGTQQIGARPALQEVQLVAGVNATAMAERLLQQTPIYELQLQQWLARVPMGGRIKVPIQSQPVILPTAHTASVEVALKGMTIRQVAPQPKQVEAQHTIVQTQAAPIVVAQQNAPLPSRSHQEFRVQPQSHIATPTEMTPREQNYLVSRLRQENWTQPSMSQRARELVEQEKGPAPTDQPTMVRNGILVATSTPPAESGPAPVALPTSILPRPPEPRAGISWAKPDDGSSARATLSGAIRLAGGLAVTDPHETIVIYREWEGLAVERGQVWLNDGRFEIMAGALRGRLLAQLRDVRGNVLGEGEVKLNQITPKADSDRIDDLMMTLRPVFEGSRIDVTSAHSYENQVITVPDSKVWMMGESQPLKADMEHRRFSEDGLKKGSSFVAQASADNHWGTIVVGLVGQESRALLFPNKLINALVNLTTGENQDLGSRSGVIWGRITKNGTPVAGARIEMAADHRTQAHYFNALLIPDRMAEATGENGTFAFVDVTPGIQSVRVIYQGQAWPAQIVPVERNHVSYLDFELGTPESVPLEIYDPFDAGKELNGILRWAGDETSEIDIHGRGRLGIPSGPGVVMLEADVGEPFELMRYTVSRNTRRLQLPVVRRDWLLSMGARKRINLDAGVGLAVGFGLPEDFTVYLDRTDDSSATPEIVYFSPQGQAMFTDEGVAGGGFIIFNVPTGLRTVTLTSRTDRKVFRQVVLASPDAVNLILTQ